MELHVLYTLIFFLLALFYLLFTKLRTSDNLPPQPWKIPLLGHLHHLSGSLPHIALANLAQNLGPIIRLQLGELNSVVISSPDLAKQVMKTNDLSFANRPKLLKAEIIGYNYKDIVFAPYGDYWRQMRKICILELLSAKKVRSFESIREEESWNLVESIIKQGHVTINLSESIFAMMNVVLSRVTFGSRCKDQETLVELIEQIESLSSGFDVSDLFPSIKVLRLVTGMKKKLMKIHHKIDKVLDGMIADHLECGHADKNEDLLDVLLRLKDDDGLQFPLTYDNIKAIVLDMLAAGTDTSAVIIEWAMFELMMNPGVMHKLQGEIRRVLKGKKKVYESDIKEIDYLRLVINETMRLHPPTPLITRECREKCEIGGYNILENTNVTINVWKLGRDPNYWNNPKSFVPERFSESLVEFKGTHFEFLPFGAGRRICPGLTMGLANVELLLTRLLYHFNWKLPNGVNPENIDRSESLGASLKLKNGLYLVPSAHNTNL